ncbi:MAG: hypothetical protein CO129_05265 [Ignavibacteriales bacterium CG_4_9_14_3_um_filter_34_10]|nr:MAG: hypothetical protein CO129_05265 [Ignavibacteriales bacterium CG_4_9_14_3_um_filter_34_10]
MKNLNFILSFVLVLIVCSQTFAIPAFARKYNMSCQTCHAPFPKLKAYGDEFAGNGFALADKDTPRYYINTGDDQLSLLREIPLALRIEGYTTFNNLNSKKYDFSAPYLIKLLSGGTLSENISYYFYFFFSERGEIAGLEDAFLMFNNLFNQDLDLYVGQFQISDPLFKRELRLTFEDYQLYRARPYNSKANLTYDRGIMLTYGLPTGTDIIFEVLNGNGIGAANEYKIFEDDNYKNFFGRISQDIVDGVRIGAFGYFGKETLKDEILPKKFDNEFLMWGPDLTLNYQDKLELNFQYGERKDSEASLGLKDVKTKGAFGELIYSPQGDESNWYAVALYNWIDSDQVSLKTNSLTFGLGYLLRRNIRLIGEITNNFERKYNQFTFGIISAF